MDFAPKIDVRAHAPWPQKKPLLCKTGQHSDLLYLGNSVLDDEVTLQNHSCHLFTSIPDRPYVQFDVWYLNMRDTEVPTRVGFPNHQSSKRMKRWKGCMEQEHCDRTTKEKLDSRRSHPVRAVRRRLCRVGQNSTRDR